MEKIGSKRRTNVVAQAIQKRAWWDARFQTGMERGKFRLGEGGKERTSREGYSHIMRLAV